MKKEISLKQLADYLNRLLDASAFDEKAYNGVQIETKVPINNIAIAVSVSSEVISEAANIGAQALIVHHGIFCKGDAHPLVGQTYNYVAELIKNNIALLCYHLPLDAHQTVGNNWKAAQDLGLTNCQPFFEYGNNTIGVISEVNNLPFEQFKQQVETYYGRPSAHVKVHDTVAKVAIISGGADKFIKDAADAGADCFITGRVDEKVWDDAHEYGVSFLGLGHYGTETVGPKALAENVAQHFGIPATFIKTENPF